MNFNVCMGLIKEWKFSVLNGIDFCPGVGLAFSPYVTLWPLFASLKNESRVEDTWSQGTGATGELAYLISEQNEQKGDSDFN